MSGQRESLLRRRFGVAPLPLAAGAAIVAGTLTLMIWQSPRSIVADVNPLILDFGSTGTQSQRHQRGESADASTSDPGNPASDPDGPSEHAARRPGEPIRSQSSNGGLVLEWPRQRKQIDAAAADAKSQARQILEEAEAYLRAGDLRRALNSARLAYSYPVKWEADEQSPEELLAQLEALARNPVMLDAARHAAVQRINSANDLQAEASGTRTAQASGEDPQTHSEPTSTTSVQPGAVIGVWKPAPLPTVSVPTSVLSAETSSGRQADGASVSFLESAGNIETASATRFAEVESDDVTVVQPYQSQPYLDAERSGAPRRLDVTTHPQQAAAEFPGTGSLPLAGTPDPRPLIMTDQRMGVDAAESPVTKLTFDVLATLTTIFAVLFFGALFLFLAILAVGRKLIGEKGVAFRIELVNSPLTVSSGAMPPGTVPPAQPNASAASSTQLNIDPDFEGILSMSEHRARERESAILEQFIQNNVSLHQQVNASRGAA